MLDICILSWVCFYCKDIASWVCEICVIHFPHAFSGCSISTGCKTDRESASCLGFVHCGDGGSIRQTHPEGTLLVVLDFVP
jgi:hypothetical protein